MASDQSFLVKSSSTSVYQKLTSGRSIRLLKFLPGLVPSCRLIIVDIFKAPPYLALSYTWGPQTLDHSIPINNYPLAITKNLNDALTALHDYVRDGRLMLWVDFICINQSDLYERGQQVRIMNAIYRSAECVAIWLGKSYEDSDFAMDKMREWKAEFDRLYEACGRDHDMTINSILPSNSVFYGPTGSSQLRAWQALQRLLQRDWWTRAWIVQEATVLGPSRTRIFCGNRIVDWDCFRVTLLLGYHVNHFPEEGTSVSFDHGMAVRLDGFRTDRETGAYMPLLRVLQHIRAYECTDPRDKVFAALGMSSDVTENDIVPDYTQSIEAVYADVVRFLLHSSDVHSLDFLGYVFRSQFDSKYLRAADENMPSWIPDWRTRCYFFAFEKLLDPDDFSSVKAYNASGKLNARARIDGPRLCVHGFSLDTITEIWPSCEENLQESGTSIERSWTPANHKDDYPTGGTVGEAFNHTLVADIGRTDLESDSELQRGFAMDWSLVDTEISVMNAMEKKKRSYMLVDLKRTTFGRRLFQTRNKFIGLGPAATKVNDTVCVLFGGQVLYILRKIDSKQYEFIGECYLHGMMDGQALTNVSNKEEEFVIV